MAGRRPAARCRGARAHPRKRGGVRERGATLWEIAIKVGIGKPDADLGAIVDELAPNDFALLPIQPRHALALAGLPRHHRDPFDRMLIVQARCEGLAIVTAGNRFGRYGVMLVACTERTDPH